MDRKHILLDTNVVSHAQKQTVPPAIKEFMLGLPRDSVAVSTETIFEIKRGILLRMETDPVRAEQLSNWLERFLDTNVHLLTSNVRSSGILAEMSMCGPLKNFWVQHPNSGKIQFGTDLRIAAITIAHRKPIATCNVKDFLLIHKYFPVPGLYDPMNKIWHVDPPPGWLLDEPANDDRLVSSKIDWKDAFDFSGR